jgi:hypothetical protein
VAGDLRQPAGDEEDLDEDGRVADDLDVDRRELADDGDPVGARGAEDDSDRQRAADADPATLSVAFSPSQKSGM